MKNIFFLCMALAIAGCMTSTPDKYYLLEVPKPEAKAAISLARLDLPEYLEQNCLVRRCKGNRIEYIEGHTWACSLKQMLEDGINDALAPDATRKISLKVRRFEVADDNVFHVRIECMAENKRGNISFELPCNSQYPQAIADAYCHALSEIQKRLGQFQN